MDIFSFGSLMRTIIFSIIVDKFEIIFEQYFIPLHLTQLKFGN